MRYRTHTANHLTSIETWLNKLGLNQVKRDTDDRLRVDLQTANENRYRVYFLQEGEDILFESVVLRPVTGDQAKTAEFYQMLVAYNAAVRPLHFGLVQVPGPEWRIVLGASQPSRFIDPKYVEHILNQYDLAYARHIPQIKKHIANTPSLQEEGKLPASLRRLIDLILG